MRLLALAARSRRADSFSAGGKMTDRSFEMYFDANGVLTERRWLDGKEVVVHYDDIPDKDITSVDGIPCTTALRTLIDLAPELPDADLARAVQDCLDRGLFTVEEAYARIAEPDMQQRRGASLLQRHLPR
jgi:hypothetical protein